jgi:hypothetical protein
MAMANGLIRKPDRSLWWLFYPGMLQESNRKWWADFGIRASCHEGIDICFYRFGAGPIHSLPPGAQVPAMAPGRVLNITEDLLGKSLVVSLPDEPWQDGGPVMVYSHLDPGIAMGDEIKTSSILGQTFDTRTKQSKLRAHLHISCICLPAGLAPEELNWTLFMDRERVFHINPVFMGNSRK